MSWQRNAPPNGVWVEVKNDDQVIEAMAIYGRDGCRPHWKLRNGALWPANAFLYWRNMSGGDDVTLASSYW